MKSHRNFIFPFYILLSFSLSMGCSGSTEQEAKQTVSISSIENLSRYIFKRKFDQIQNDKFLKNNFKIKKDVMEDEGVTWGVYELTRGLGAEVLIENNWQDSNTISRITYVSDKYYTTEGTRVGSSFANIKNHIDSISINEAPDGLLVLHEKRNPGISFILEVTGNADMYEGINNIHQIPDTMKVSTIVVIR